MKTKHYLSIALGLFICSSLITSAQDFKPFNHDSQEHMLGHRQEHRGPDFMADPTISDEQKTQLKEMHELHVADVKSISVKLEALKAKQKTLVESASPDIKAVEKNIDEIAKTQAALEKLKVAHHVEFKKIVPNMGKKHLSQGMRKGMAPHSDVACNGEGHNNGMRGRGERGGMQNGKTSGSEHKQMGMAERRHAEGRMKANRHNSERGQMKAHSHNASVKGNFVSEDTKALIKENMIATSASTRDLKNKLNELHVAQKALFIKDDVDIKAVNKTIDEVAKLRAQIMKIETKAKLDLLAKLTPEEREKVLMLKSKGMKGDRHRG